MTKTEWIKNEIALWRSEGVIGEDLAGTLLQRYPERESKISWGAVIAGCFGALMIGLGIIALFAANWDVFDRGWRAVISITPLVLCGMIAIVASIKNVKTMSFWEPLGILWAISTCAATCLVAQTYQVGGSVPGLILLVALLTLPVVWVTKSVALTSFWPIFAIVWTVAAEDKFGDSWLLAFKSLGLMALSLPAYIAFLRRSPSRAALIFGQIVTGIVFSFGAAVMVIIALPFPTRLNEEIYVCIYWAFSAITFFSAVKFKLPVWKIISMVVMCVAAMLTAFQEIWMYVISLIFATGIIVYGISCVKLSCLNTGSVLLLWLILAKFFESEIGFTAKGLILIASGVALTLLNVVMFRFKKRRAVK